MSSPTTTARTTARTSDKPKCVADFLARRRVCRVAADEDTRAAASRARDAILSAEQIASHDQGTCTKDDHPRDWRCTVCARHFPWLRNYEKHRCHTCDTMANYVHEAILTAGRDERRAVKPGTARDRGLRPEYEFDSDYCESDYCDEVLDLTCAMCGCRISRARFHRDKLCGECGLHSEGSSDEESRLEPDHECYDDDDNCQLNKEFYYNYNSD